MFRSNRIIFVVVLCVVNFIRHSSPQAPASAIADAHDNAVASVGPGSVLGLACPVRSMDCSGITWSIIGGNFISVGMTVGDDYNNIYYVNSTGGYCMLYVRILSLIPIPPIYCLQQTKAQKSFHIFVTDSVVPVCTSSIVSQGRSLPDDQEMFTYLCSITYSSMDQLAPVADNVIMQWLNSGSEVVNATGTKATASNPVKISLGLQLTAVAPMVDRYVCRATFGVLESNPKSIECAMPATAVTYAVKNVVLSPPPTDNANYRPGTVVTCSAEGLPPPTFKWVSSPPEQTFDGPTMKMNSSSPYEYQCVASNLIRGQTIQVSSPLVTFNTTMDDAVQVETASSQGWIAGVVIGVILLAVIIALVLCFVLPRCPIRKAYVRRKEKKYVMKSASGYDESETLPTTASPSNIDSSDAPDIVPVPRPKPRGSLNPKPAPRSNSPPNKSDKSSIDDSSKGELLYAEVQTDRPRKPRPPRPEPKRREDTIYTPVARS